MGFVGRRGLRTPHHEKEMTAFGAPVEGPGAGIPCGARRDERDRRAEGLPTSPTAASAGLRHNRGQTLGQGFAHRSALTGQLPELCARLGRAVWTRRAMCRDPDSPVGPSSQAELCFRLALPVLPPIRPSNSRTAEDDVRNAADNGLRTLS